MKLCFLTFGCKANQYDTQAMRELCQKHGFEEVLPEQKADIYVVNSCTVTHRASTELKKAIRKITKTNPQAKIIITGCAVAVKEELKKLLEDVNSEQLVVMSHYQKPLLPQILNGQEAEKLAPEDIFKMQISRFDFHTRAFVKIQDGCSLRCSFCIIPQTRGPSVSRKPQEIIQEIKRLIEANYKEIVLTGIHIGSYGQDFAPKIRLVELIKEILDIPGLHRLRLSSLEVNEVYEDLISLMRSNSKICPHLHIPLQSGSDRILSLMNRNYNSEQFLKTTKWILNEIPDCAITTDIIVGFPGETEEDFAQTMELARKIGFSRIHIFPFSPRADTKAACLPDAVHEKIKRNRVNILKDVASRLSYNFHKRFLGKEAEVILEEAKDGEYFGYTEHYIYAKICQENYSKKISRGQILKVQIMEVTPHQVLARPVNVQNPVPEK